MWSVGKRIVFAEIIFSYLLPAALYFILRGNAPNEWIPEPLGVTFWVLLASTITSFFLFGFLLSGFEKKLISFNLFSRRLTIRGAFAAFAVIFSICSAIFLLRGLNHYRYDRTPASERLSVPLLVALFGKSFVAFQALFMLINGPDRRIFRDYRWYWPLIVVSLAFSVDGSMSLLLVLIVMGITLFPRLFAPLLYSLTVARKKKFFALMVAVPILCVILLSAAWFFGESVKRNSVESAKAAFFESGAHMFYWYANRISTHFYSLNIIGARALRDPHLVSNAWEVIRANTYYRACVILGSICSSLPPRPDIVQISHLNDVLITASQTVRSGSSPGVIVSALYLFPFPLAPLVAGLFYYFVSLLVDYGNIFPKERLSFIGCLVGVFLLRAVLLDPADMVLALDTELMDFAVFTVACLLAHERNRAWVASPDRAQPDRSIPRSFSNSVESVRP